MGTICNRYGEEILSYEGPLKKVNLRGANLWNANLVGADLQNAGMWDAFLKGANLRRANLANAHLQGADLRHADLCGANLQGADLRNTNLQGADLRNASLRGVTLQNANMEDVDLQGVTNIPPDYIALCKSDFINTVNLFRTNGEVPFLRQAIVEGRIAGTQYIGECVCLIGTLAEARNENVHSLCAEIGYRMGLHNPAEQWFQQIYVGDTPEKSFFAKVALEWCDEIIASDQSSN